MAGYEIINQNFRAVGHIILVYDESKNEIRAFTNSLSSINKDVLKKNIIEINIKEKESKANQTKKEKVNQLLS